MQLHLSVDHRVNRFKKKGEEWAFNAQFVGRTRWTVTTWDHDPTADEINYATELILRAFEIYHDTLETPRFKVDVVSA